MRMQGTEEKGQESDLFPSLPRLLLLPRFRGLFVQKRMESDAHDVQGSVQGMEEQEEEDDSQTDSGSEIREETDSSSSSFQSEDFSSTASEADEDGEDLDQANEEGMVRKGQRVDMFSRDGEDESTAAGKAKSVDSPRKESTGAGPEAGFTVSQPRLSCDSCLMEFNRKSHQMAHSPCYFSQRGLNETHYDSVNCTFCYKVFPDLYKLRKHLEIHVDNIFVCNECRKGFAYRCQIVAHLRVHTGECPFKCKHCDKSYQMKHQLKTHLQEHQGSGDFLVKSFDCSQCSQNFTQTDQLLHHMRQHQRDSAVKLSQPPGRSTGTNQGWRCSWTGCGKRFETKLLYKCHIMRHKSNAF